MLLISNFSCFTDKLRLQNTDQAARVHWSLDINYINCPKMLLETDSMIKRHMKIHADLSVSTILESG